MMQIHLFEQNLIKNVFDMLLKRFLKRFNYTNLRFRCIRLIIAGLSRYFEFTIKSE